MSLIWSPGLYSDLLGRSVRARCGLLEPAESDLRPSARVLVFASDPDCLLSSPPPLRVEAERRARASPPSPSSPSPRPESLTRR